MEERPTIYRVTGKVLLFNSGVGKHACDAPSDTTPERVFGVQPEKKTNLANFSGSRLAESTYVCNAVRDAAYSRRLQLLGSALALGLTETRTIPTRADSLPAFRERRASVGMALSAL